MSSLKRLDHKLLSYVFEKCLSDEVTTTSMTEFPCTFPCAWHGQTFDIYKYLGNFKTTWTFNSDGQTSVFTDQTNNTVTYRCHQIMERFLILREEGLDNFICLQIIYDLAKPLEFILESSLNAFSKGSFDCLKPSTCSSPAACNMNDTIPKTCAITTTENLTTTVKQTTTVPENLRTTVKQTTTVPEITSPPEPTKTTKSQCGKKNHTQNSN
ncbi:Hypothetical predicted protein [Mytilus galloprovincialis]|uniref:Uncharacterized protein n=1 Tax=Mytilus galloprovincialis TaxID=29158 RepID=A0A8B6CL51_MYTGA|nr:Hypothetical predicted protein [Mytilus galloprovincialis]